ncbi:transmembrane protein 135-like [Octopus sinensis]|uniref:Transmembrane protein 135-like n=1 Tax=Octopus sinensis TaxID=2607531 RepID=A0A6P7SYN1_9MOLL|nr:transmembrane protein 135-like [Octopus sinensis]
MANLSKPLGIKYSCYEVGHTWNPYCLHATKDIAKHGFKEALKIYTLVYVFAAIVRKRGLEYYKKQLIPEILHSSLFLSTNAYSYVAFFCLWRYVFGNIYFLTTGFLPAASAALLSICLERKSRRGLLALYVTNLAIETMYRMSVYRKYIKPVKNGEVLMFSVVSAVFLYLYKSKGGLSTSVASVIRFFVGAEEHADSTEDSYCENEQNLGASPLKYNSNKYLEYIKSLKKRFEQSPRHPLCKHNDGCIHYILRGFSKMAGVGFGLQIAVKLVPNVIRILRKPTLFLQLIWHQNNLKLGAFLGLFSTVFRGSNCALRWLRQKDSSVNGFVAGFLAGWSMLCYKSSTLALYSAMKLLQVLYFKGVEKKAVPHIHWADIFLYTLSTAFIFHVAIFEPHNLRPSYWKFLLRVTNNKLGEINRQILNAFQTKASELLPDFWPNYNPAFTNLIKPDHLAH